MTKEYIPKLLMKVLLSTASVAFFQGTYADTPYRTYIWSTTDPSVYFYDGMAPRGTDYNLLDLVSGNSVARDTTGYVSTSANRIMTVYRIWWLLSHRTDDEPTEYWQYTIRPSLSFYNVADSLDSSAQVMRNQNPELFNRLEAMETLVRNSNVNMWVTRGEIMPSQIESASLYQLVNNTLATIETRYNPNYIPADPVVSPDHILVTGSTDQYIFYSDLGSFHILPGAFCQAFYSGIKRMKNEDNAVTCTQYTYADLELKLKRNLILISS